MTATVFEIKRFAVHDGDGIRTTVFLKGCPLTCVWCHNPEGLSPTPELAFYAHKCVFCGACVAACLNGAHNIENSVHTLDREKCVSCGRCEGVCYADALKLYGKKMTVDELLPLLLEDRDFYETSGGGVTLSGGECLTHADFCASLLQKLKEEGIHTAVDTSGFVSQAALDKVMPYTDIFLYDVKAVDNAVHTACTGCENKRILDNLRYIDECGKAIEVRIPFVPAMNDGEIGKIGELLSSLKNLTKVRLLPYHNYAGSKYAAVGRESTLPERLPTPEELNAAKETLRTYGITVYE